jgi:hypothetical protein
MATGTKSDFVIYHNEFFSGMNEIVQQNSGVFNAASANAMRLVPRMLKGDFEKESFFKAVETLVSHRDPTDTSAVTAQKLEQGELVGVKLNRKIGPAEQTMDAFRKIQVDPREFSFILGQQAGEEALRDYVNTGALAVTTALNTQAALVTSVLTESDTNLKAEYLIRSMAKMGDRSQRVRAWVMHSKPWFALMEGQVAGGATNIADVVIYGGAPGTLGRPVIVTDSPYLINLDSDGVAESYKVLGLTDSAVVLNQSEDESILSDTVLGKENIIMQYQGEYAYNLRIKGFAYDGSANPNDATLGTPASWNYLMHDVKMGPGVLLVVE